MTKLAGKAKARKRKNNQKKQKARKQNYMSKLVAKIKLHSDPVLFQKCDPIETGEIKDVAHELKKVLAATSSGVGLAAPQLGITKNIFISRLDPTVNVFKVFANPVILEEEETQLSMMEGCLSYPDFFTKIERPWKIKVEYTNEYLIKRQEELTGFMSRIFCHEYDHLSGVCLVGRKWAAQSKKQD